MKCPLFQLATLALATSGCHVVLSESLERASDGGRIDGARIDGGRTGVDASLPRPATCCVWNGPEATDDWSVNMNEAGDLVQTFETDGPALSRRVRVRRCDGETQELTVVAPTGYTGLGSATWAGRDHLWAQMDDDSGNAARGVFDLAGDLVHAFEHVDGQTICLSGESVFTLGPGETTDWEVRRFDVLGMPLDSTTGNFGETTGGVPARSDDAGGCPPAATRGAGDGFVVITDEEGAEWRWDGVWTRLSEPCTWPGAAAACLDESTDLVSEPHQSAGSARFFDSAGGISFLRAGVLASDGRTFMFELRDASGVVQWTNTELRWGSESGLPLYEEMSGAHPFSYQSWSASNGDVGVRVRITSTGCYRQRVGLAGHPLANIFSALIRFDRATGAIAHIDTFAGPTETRPSPACTTPALLGVVGRQLTVYGGDECNGVLYEFEQVLHRLDENGDPAPRRTGTP
jgi:hypothetical protein